MRSVTSSVSLGFAVLVLAGTVTAAAADSLAPAVSSASVVGANGRPQVITVTTEPPSSAMFGDVFIVEALRGASDQPLLWGAIGGCVNLDPSGIPTNVFTMTSGSTDCTITIDEAGGNGYLDAPQVVRTVAAVKAPQAIEVTTEAPSVAAYLSTFTVTATGGASGLALEFGSDGGCTNVDGVYTMTSPAIDCEVHIDQPGDANFAPASQSVSMVIATPAAATPITLPTSVRRRTAFVIPRFTAERAPVEVSVRGNCRLVRNTSMVDGRLRLRNYIVRVTGKGSCYVTVSAEEIGYYESLLQPDVRVRIR